MPPASNIYANPSPVDFSPAYGGFPITAADADIRSCRGLSFSGEGTLVLTFIDGTVQTIPSGHLATNVIHPICFYRVAAASTATGIWGWY